MLRVISQSMGFSSGQLFLCRFTNLCGGCARRCAHVQKSSADNFRYRYSDVMRGQTQARVRGKFLRGRSKREYRPTVRYTVYDDESHIPPTSIPRPARATGTPRMHKYTPQFLSHPSSRLVPASGNASCYDKNGRREPRSASPHGSSEAYLLRGRGAGELAAGEVPLANVVPCRDASRGTDVVEVVKVLPLLTGGRKLDKGVASVARKRSTVVLHC